ncbi:MAG: VCBS repeat-containing protein [Verrucomicrobia bacterium]|nr:VCBS repeat-containing protein [Verrucomicrobiota bacterium]MBU1735643.1 VCBS repeat-containing protein [Verrucomicrobiota bacterium]MBU1856693.1 VCBS repeat-containing protein [Verrucomicrobiota bacterium]
MKKHINSMGRLVPPCVIMALMAALALPWLALAQTNAPAASAIKPPEVKSGNMLPPVFNGETTTNLGNYWDGVDDDNDLHVNVANSLVLNDAGQMVDTPMSSCPNFVDMNGDGLNDLVVSDTQGFLWIYLNSGEKGKPKFTTGTFIPTFIGWGAKIHVCDWDGDGDNDILFGTFTGDIGILANTGTSQQWQFTRRMGKPRYVDPLFGVDDPQDRLPTLMLGKQTMILGNYMSPWVTDWNKDGKPDLILGEGTYSANSVRLLLNAGSRNKPVFIEDRMFYLSYGEGFEQLTPSVVDYNGDGLPDLIVGTRTGQIRLHKGTQKAIEGKDMVAALRGILAPAVLEFDGFIKIANKTVFDTMSFVYPCDWNEDGLFDLLLGSPKGKVYIALNQGSKTEPKFPKAEPVKGTDTAKDMLAPANWMNGIIRVFWQNFIGGYCNSALLFSAEKELILKAGDPPIRPVDGNTFMYFRYVNNYQGFTRNHMAWIRPINKSPTVEHVVGARVVAPLCTFNLKLKRQYEISFSSILEGKPATWTFWTRELVKPGTEDIADHYETQYAFDIIPPSVGWQKRTYRFKCPSMVQSNYNYHLYFRMPEGNVKFLLDNLSVKEIER